MILFPPSQVEICEMSNEKRRDKILDFTWFGYKVTSTKQNFKGYIFFFQLDDVTLQ